ncbi:MAG: hypothetical protein AB1600_06625 [Bacteroidota bacterium]
MTEEELLLEIEQAAQDIGVRIRYEKGNFDGGYCILRDERIIVVNKKLSERKKCSVIAQALGEYGIDNVYMKPVVRTYVEDEIVRAQMQTSKNVIKRKEHTEKENTAAHSQPTDVQQ